MAQKILTNAWFCVYSKTACKNTKAGRGSTNRLRATELGKTAQGGKTLEELTGE